ncbi:hypothetical protein VTK26DRAFT_2490 [Humicola hyalothermophila]
MDGSKAPISPTRQSHFIQASAHRCPTFIPSPSCASRPFVRISVASDFLESDTQPIHPKANMMRAARKATQGSTRIPQVFNSPSHRGSFTFQADSHPSPSLLQVRLVRQVDNVTARSWFVGQSAALENDQWKEDAVVPLIGSGSLATLDVPRFPSLGRLLNRNQQKTGNAPFF